MIKGCFFCMFYVILIKYNYVIYYVGDLIDGNIK